MFMSSLLCEAPTHMRPHTYTGAHAGNQSPRTFPRVFRGGHNGGVNGYGPNRTPGPYNNRYDGYPGYGGSVPNPYHNYPPGAAPYNNRRDGNGYNGGAYATTPAGAPYNPAAYAGAAGYAGNTAATGYSPAATGAGYSNGPGYAPDAAVSGMYEHGSPMYGRGYAGAGPYPPSGRGGYGAAGYGPMANPYVGGYPGMMRGYPGE
jgi:hypothetical protein